MTNQFAITKAIIESNLKQSHDITTAEKAVLVTLSSYLGNQENSAVFSCYPSQSRIANLVGCTRSTVNDALKKFERLGFLRANYRTTAEGGNTSKLYTWLGIPSPEDTEESESSIIEPSESEVVEERTVVVSPAPVDNSATEPTISPVEVIETRPSSDWWDDFEAEIAEESPF